jgi:negative modulator of initiation of replication
MATELEVVEVEREVVQFLDQRKRFPGESLSHVLRRLLSIPQAGELLRAQALLGDDFWQQPTVIGRFLSVLRSLYLENPAHFEGVLKIRGRSRVYFARTARQIEKAGKGTHTYPRRIPDSPFWVCSNFNNYQKGVLLLRVLGSMNYEESEKWKVVKALTASVEARIRGR